MSTSAQDQALQSPIISDDEVASVADAPTAPAAAASAATETVIPDSEVVAAVEPGVIPDTEVVATIPEEDHLKKLPRRQLVEEAKKALMAGDQDVSKYRRAFLERSASGDLLDENFFEPTNSDGTRASVLQRATAMAKDMWDGTVELAREAKGATGIDWSKTDLVNGGITTLPQGEALQHAENIAQQAKIKMVQAAGDVYRFASRVANRFFGANPNDPDHSYLNDPKDVRTVAFNHQFDTELTLAQAEEGMRQGSQVSGKTLPTNPEKIDSMLRSPLGDPTFVVPMAEGFALGRGAGALAARTLESGGTKALDQIALEGLGKVLAKPVAAAGVAARAASKTLDGSPLLSGLASAGIAAAAGGSVDTEIIAGLLGTSTKGASIINRVADSGARSLENSAGKLAGKIPPGPIGRFAIGAYNAVAPELRSAVAGQLANTPFLLGAGDKNSFEDMMIGGLVLHAGSRALGATVNGLDITNNLWKARNVAPENRLAVKDYGVDPALDLAHREVVDSLGNTGNNFVQSVRDYFGKNRGELYTLSQDGYAAALDKFAKDGHITQDFADLAKQQAGVTLPPIKNEKGETRNIALLPVAAGVPGVSAGHEAGHLLERLLSEDERRFVRAETLRYYGEDKVNEYLAKYNELVNAAGEGPRLDSSNLDTALSEIFAEHASAVMNSVPIAHFGEGYGAGPYARTVYSMVARGLEKVGVKRPQLVDGEGPLTGTGIEPSARLGHLVENFLSAHRLDKTKVGIIGDLGVEKPAQKTVEPGVPAAPIVEKGEIAGARPVTPKEPTIGFKKGDPVDNVFAPDGTLLAENAKVTKALGEIAGEPYYEIEYTHPDTGARMLGNVPEGYLRSPVKAGAGKPVATVNGAIPVPHPVTDTSAPGYVRPEDVIQSRQEAKLPVPDQVENTVRPEAAKPNVRVTPLQQEQFAQKASESLTRQNAAAVKSITNLPRAKIPAFETDYYSAKSTVEHPDALVREEQRRLADKAEKEGGPNALRALYQKVFVPYKFMDGPRPRVFGFSMDKFIQNADLVRAWLSEKGQDASYFASPELVKDAQAYLQNQAHGYGGNGQKLVRPADTKPGTITPEDPNYTPVPLSTDVAQRINLLMGFELPGKRTPTQSFFERFARLNGIEPVALETGVAEVNPLRAQMRNAGFDLRVLNGAVENLPIENFTTPVKMRDDLRFNAGDTGISQAGFMPKVDRVVETPEFKKWFGASKVVDAEGNPQVVFHGTTNDFTTFDRTKANSESDMGAGFYFSNKPEDVAHNYAGEGPDLTNKLETLAERFESNDDLPREVALEKARSLLSQHQGATLPVFLSLKKPAILGGPKETFLDGGVDFEGDRFTGKFGKFLEALKEEAREFGDHDVDATVSHLVEKFGYDGGAKLSEIWAEAKNHEGLVYTTDDVGNLVGSELLRRALEKTGFDGIIDYTVNDKFGSSRAIGKSMAGMDEDTVHYVAFKPEQIKSATGNSGKFSRRNPDIRFMPKVQFSGKPLEHAVEGTLRLRHWGNAGQKTADPRNFGKSGLTPRSELSGSPRTYFYEAGKENKTDPVLGRQNIYDAVVSGNRIYDGDADPLNWSNEINREKADEMLKRAGYVGVVRTAGRGKAKYRQVEMFRPVALSAVLKNAPITEVQFMPKKPAEAIEDFKSDTLPQALKRPGWTILTATQERLGKATDPKNLEANQALEAELQKRGLPYKKVAGSYLGEDQGVNFLVTGVSERSALALGKKFKQESVLTNRGYLYQDGSIAPLNHKNNVYGDAAKEQSGYSVLPDGTAFSAGIDWDTRIQPSPTETPAYREVAKHLTEHERANMREDVAADLIKLTEQLPPDADFQTAVHMGAAKKGWYARAASTLREIFGPDTEKFVSLLAATSPRQSVEKNLVMSLEAWKMWTDAGRPEDPATLKQMFAKHVELEARLGNVVRAFTGKDLVDSPIAAPKKLNPGTELSGFKVESFRRNLLGDLLHSTNDSWMANFSGIPQAVFGTKSGYLAFTSKIRRVANKVNMEPAEVQETIWSFFKTLVESTKVDRPAKEALASLSEKDILSTPEFHDLLTEHPEIIDLLEQVGFPKDRLARLVDPEVAGKRANPDTRPLADVIVQEGKGNHRVLARLSARAQEIKNAELAGAKAAPVASPSEPADF